MNKFVIIAALSLLFSVTTRAQNRTFVPTCGGINDTAKLQVLIDTIEDNTGTIRLPFKDATRCATNSITFPENITIDNSDGTGLWRNTGAVVTVLGPVVTPIGKPVFLGPGTTNFTGNTHIGTAGQSRLSDGAGGETWGDVTGGGGGPGVSSFKARTGDVLPAANDYSAEQLSNGVTGSGPVVLQNTPTIAGLLAPTVNGLTITPSNGALTIANNKSLTVSSSLAFVGLADGFTFTIPGTGTAVLTTRTITEGAGLAGNTFDLGANRTLAMGTPSGLSISSTNSVGGSTHSHAIASSSNPGPAASLLASDAGGRLQLAGLGIGITGTEPLEVAGNIFVNAATANLFLKDTGTGLQSSATGIVALQAGNCLRSTNFTSGLVGLNICSNGNAEFDNVDVRGAIHAGIIVYNAQMTTAGTLGVFKSAAKLRTDFTVPAGPTYGTTTVQIEAVDQDGLTHAASQLFAVGDILRVKDGLIGDTWFEVTTASDQTTFWRYTARIWAGTNNATFRAGLGIADYGAAGQGFIIQTADQTNAPYLQMATHTHTFTAASAIGTLDVTPRLRLGNLNGSYGYNADSYGFATGPYGSAGQTWLTIEPTNGVRIGNNTTTIAQWATNGAITVGQVAVGQSNINISAGQILLRNNTTTRIRLDTDGSGFLANSLISWDTSGNLTVAGNATIASWTINTTRMTSGSTHVASSFDPPAGAMAWFGQSATGFRGMAVRDASNREIDVLANNGSIFPYFNVSDGTRSRVVIGGLNNNWGAEGSTNSMGLKVWDVAGVKLVEFSDVQNKIGGWTIGATAFGAGSGSTTVGLDSGGTNPAIYVGSATPGSAPFRVTNTGALTATNATITGAITATSGSFTGAVTATSGSFTGAITATSGSLSTMSLLGALTMGGASGSITMGTTPPTSASSGTGIWLDRTGLYGLASSVVQTKLDAATGAITVGSGKVTLDVNGVTIVAENAGTSRVKWTHNNIFESTISSYDNGGTQWNDSRIVAAGSTNPSVYQILASSQSGGSGASLRVWAKPASSESYGEIDGTNFKGFSIGLALNAPQPAPDAMITTFASDSALSTIIDTASSNRWTTGAGGSIASGFGVGTLYRLESRSFVMRDAARVAAIWTTATDASRTSAVVIQTVNSGGALSEVFRFAPGGMQIWDGAAMQTITFGAADSCGTGFRCVRIPN